MCDPAGPQPPHLDDDLRVVLRPAGGYSLLGLPAEGTCPQGRRGGYDQSAVVLNGWGAGTHADLSNISPAAWGWHIGLLVCITVAIVWTSCGEGIYWGLMGVWVFLPVGNSLLVLQRFASRRPGLAQARLDVNGCGQDPPCSEVTRPCRSGNAIAAAVHSAPRA